MEKTVITRKLLSTNPATQKRRLRQCEPKFSHPDRVPIEVEMEHVGWFRRKVRARTLEPIWYEDALGRMEIPAGRESDLGSSPDWLWWIVSPLDAVIEFLFHDEGYRLQPYGIGRGIWDQRLRDMMRLRNRPAWKREVVFFALRLFGGKAWRENTKKLKRAKKVIAEARKLNP